MKKKKEKYYAPYEWDSCPPTIYFIYDDKVYTLFSDAFNGTYECYHYFHGIKDIIKKDLVDAGCIYTWYID